MLKHKDIIEKLNKLEKVAIVASAFAPEPFERAGIPCVRLTELDELGKRDAVSYASAARSWDPELIGKMTGELIKKAGCKNNLFVTPDLKTSVDPAKEGLSEDACLNGEVGAKIIRAAHGAGAAVGLARPSVSAGEIAYIDVDEDYGAVHELFIKPFLRAVEDDSCDAVLMEPSRVGQGYYDTNRSLLSEIQNGLLGADAFIIGEGETFSADAVNMLRSKITLGGCTIPLERAVRRYSQLKAYEAEGSVHHRETVESLRNGSAVDDETLDGLVDNIIDFALTLDGLDDFETNTEFSSEQAGDLGADGAVETLDGSERGEIVPDPTKMTDGEESEDTPRVQLSENSTDEEESADNSVSEISEQNAELKEKAEQTPVSDGAVVESAEPVGKTIAAESVVLLKNQGALLPLASGSKVAIIGEAYVDMTAFSDKFRIVGRALGYDRAAQRSDTLIPAAVRATKNADAAIVFIYPDGSDKLALPANRIALLQALKSAHKRIIAVIAGDKPVDMSFDDGIEAVLLAPDDSPYAGEALAEILSGEREPSGRSTRTYYDDADEYFAKYRAYRDSKVMRIGSFTGYRRYGLDKAKIRFPFGCGLSYTKFDYSDLAVTADGVSFTLTNAGDRDGYEVAQVYIGAPRGGKVAPEKLLRAFERVFLKSGESRRIDISLCERDFETYDPRMYADNVETGEYIIYVGASSVDIRLRGKKTLKGVERESDNASVADFTPDGNYGDISKVSKSDRVAKKGSDLPRDLRLMHKAALYAVPVLATLFFVAMSIFILSYSFEYVALTTLERDAVEQIMFFSAVAVILLVPIVGSLNRKRLVRIRNVSLLLTPFLILTLILYCVLVAGSNEKQIEIALEALSCITVGVPIVAIIAACIERQLWRDKMGKNRWDKYYFERETGDRTTSDEDFDIAMRAAEAAREAVAASEQKDDAPVIVTEAPQFYDKRLTYTQMLGDCKQFVAESGLEASEDDLTDYIAALSSTQLVFVPRGDGAALCQAVSEYFGRKPYVDNAENYARYDDLFKIWHSGGYVSTPTNLAVALEKATKETAYLHTVLIRHIDKNMIKPLFDPLADVLARRKMTFAVGDNSVSLPSNMLIVAEVESDALTLPEDIAQVAAVLSPKCEEREPAPRRTIVQTVGFERITAMSRAVRDDYPLSEDKWKLIDRLDEHCRSGHIANNIWNRMELHSSVVVACGGEEGDALDRAMAAELLPWLSSIWDEETSESSLRGALAEIFDENELKKSFEYISGDNGDDNE